MESCAGLAASPSEALQLHCRRPQSMSRQSALSLPWAVLPATTFRPATPVYDERARLVTVWRRPPHTPANVSIRSAALARPSLWIEEDQGPRGPPRFPASTRGARSHAVPDLRAVGDAPRRLVVLRLVQQQLLPRVLACLVGRRVLAPGRREAHALRQVGLALRGWMLRKDVHGMFCGWRAHRHPGRLLRPPPVQLPRCPCKRSPRRRKRKHAARRHHLLDLDPDQVAVAVRQALLRRRWDQPHDAVGQQAGHVGPMSHGGCNSVSGIPPTSPGPPSRASSLAISRFGRLAVLFRPVSSCLHTASPGCPGPPPKELEAVNGQGRLVFQPLEPRSGRLWSGVPGAVGRVTDCTQTCPCNAHVRSGATLFTRCTQSTLSACRASRVKGSKHAGAQGALSRRVGCLHKRLRIRLRPQSLSMPLPDPPRRPRPKKKEPPLPKHEIDLTCAE
jgi:hypothetical protein